MSLGSGASKDEGGCHHSPIAPELCDGSRGSYQLRRRWQQRQRLLLSSGRTPGGGQRAAEVSGGSGRPRVRAGVVIGRGKLGRLYPPLISWSRRVQPGHAVLFEAGGGDNARSDSGSNAMRTFRLVSQIRRYSLAFESSHPAAASIAFPRGATGRRSRSLAPAAAGLSPEDATWLKAPAACARRS